ncbi:MAG: bis(5'-nucleosyl)-tetraphosphatase (symmetrical) YqeK [Clostridia bacterium]|nr:bis(5'-nucleosyl)-tetraphosphatase (symmetrical) YqeK [Clostridia bacterium]
MSDYRFSHTLGVEAMAIKLGELYAPDKIMTLRAAALLHDVTKENSFEKQLQICEKLGIIISSAKKSAPKTLHAITGSAIIPVEYPEFATDEVTECVKWHTTGKENMSICEKLIYFADYIEDGRTLEYCVALRDYFFSASPEKMTSEDRLIHLDNSLILSFDMTIKHLLSKGATIDPDTTAARNWLITNKKQLI